MIIVLHLFSQELDYQDITPIGEQYARVDAFLRDVPEPFQLPEEFVNKPGEKMIYVSLGKLFLNIVSLCNLLILHRFNGLN